MDDVFLILISQINIIKFIAVRKFEPLYTRGFKVFNLFISHDICSQASISWHNGSLRSQMQAGSSNFPLCPCLFLTCNENHNLDTVSFSQQVDYYSWYETVLTPAISLQLCCDMIYYIMQSKSSLQRREHSKSVGGFRGSQDSC